jgi:hypothetical protein
MKPFVNVLLVLTVLVVAAASSADVPHLINYQGILTDSGGQPLDGSHDLTFKIYPDSGAATPALWTEQHMGVDVDQGLFNVILGSNTAIPTGLFADPQRWIGIAVDADAEMYPRMRITSVPWAMRAAVADSALNAVGGGDGHSLDADDGDPVDAVYVDSDGNVGINTTEPAEKLDIVGTAKMDGFQLTTAPASGYVLTSDASGVGSWQATGAVADGDWTISGDDMYSNPIGNVGIGDMSPNSKLDVHGDINVVDHYKILDKTVLHVDGISNVAVGSQAGEYNSSWGCALMGRWAGHSNSGYCNTFVGTYAGTTSTGGQNTFVGFNSGNANTSGESNTFVGYTAGRNNTEGLYNTFLGCAAGANNIGGDYNIFVGRNAGTASKTGTNNVFVGDRAGDSNSNGVENVFLGSQAGHSLVTGSRNVFIGYRAGFNETGSDNLYIANGQDDGDVLIYGDFADGQVGIGTLDPAADLEIYRDANDFVGMYITNPNTGQSSAEGIYFENEDGTVAGLRLDNTDRMNLFCNRPDGYITLGTGGTPRITITEGGWVGIGTGTPDTTLHVDNTIMLGTVETIADIGSNLLSSDANWVPDRDNIWTLGNSTNRWKEVWAVDGTINTSDERLEEGVSDLDYGLDEVLKLRPVSFTWRDRPEAGRKLGLIAQEVEPVMSEVVASTETVVAEGPGDPQPMTKPAENLGIYYSELIPVLIKAVQEQQNEIQEQAERISELEARIAEMENR